jgi:cobalamin biosynthesis Mg chelatase CobN
VFEFRRQRSSVRESSSPASVKSHAAASHRVAAGTAGASLLSRLTSPSAPSRRNGSGREGSRREGSRREREAAASPRELPDVTGFLVVVLVTLGLFVVPVGATIMQGPAIVASLLGK